MAFLFAFMAIFLAMVNLATAAALPDNAGNIVNITARAAAAGEALTTPASASLINSVLGPANAFRARKGLPQFQWADLNYQNSNKAGARNIQLSPNGAQMYHYLYPGTWAQVIAPGIDSQAVCSRNMDGLTPFEFALYGWLCEVPSDPAIGVNCYNVGKYNDLIVGGPETGHYGIFSSASYTKIGCSFNHFTQGHTSCSTWTGFWFCDFGW